MLSTSAFASNTTTTTTTTTRTMQTNYHQCSYTSKLLGFTDVKNPVLSSSLVFSPKAGFGRNQSPVRRPVWLWHTAIQLIIFICYSSIMVLLTLRSTKLTTTTTTTTITYHFSCLAASLSSIQKNLFGLLAHLGNFLQHILFWCMHVSE